MPVKKVIEIHDQPRLSFTRIFLITAASIRYRLFRSVVTLGVIIIAVAFLMNILAEGLIKEATLEKTEKMLSEFRLAAKWVSRLSAPDSLESVIFRAASAQSGDDTYREFSAMSGMPDADMKIFQTRAKSALYI